MLYAVLCYDSEDIVGSWSKQKDEAVMAAHLAHNRELAAAGKLGPVVRLMPTTTATTIRSGKDPVVLDGPFAETKEQFLGFWVLDCASLEEAIEAAKSFLHDSGAMEIRPVAYFEPGSGVK